jgi:hypothetical protein
LTIDRSSRAAFRAVVVVLVALLAVATFTLGRTTAPTSPARVIPSPQAVDPATAAEVAQFNALVNTPEGIAALAREFGPNSFGQAVVSSPSIPTPATVCPLQGVC